MFEDDVEYFQDLDQLYDDLPSLPERIKSKSVANLCVICTIRKYVPHIRTLKDALNID